MSLEPHRQYRQYVDSAPGTLDQSRKAILAILVSQARGYENRVSAKHLSERTTVSSSTVRDIIIKLRAEFNVPVASLGGYFIIETPDELQRVLNSKRQEIATRKERMREITAAYNQ